MFGDRSVACAGFALADERHEQGHVGNPGWVKAVKAAGVKAGEKLLAAKAQMAPRVAVEDLPRLVGSQRADSFLFGVVTRDYDDPSCEYSCTAPGRVTRTRLAGQLRGRVMRSYYQPSAPVPASEEVTRALGSCSGQPKRSL